MLHGEDTDIGLVMALGRMQNLMTSAGEALGLTEDPLHTFIGEKVSFRLFLLVSVVLGMSLSRKFLDMAVQCIIPL